jgi:hypothetical protein
MCCAKITVLLLAAMALQAKANKLSEWGHESKKIYAD